MNIKYDDLTKLFAIEQAKETSYKEYVTAKSCLILKFM